MLGGGAAGEDSLARDPYYADRACTYTRTQANIQHRAACMMAWHGMYHRTAAFRRCSYCIHGTTVVSCTSSYLLLAVGHFGNGAHVCHARRKLC
jgi:hypothetical protein